MREQARKGKILLLVLTILLGAAYFLLTYDRQLNSSDEGYLLYNFDKFARGELPHRDFYDIYGALTYFVGGGLFKLFGVNILVVKVFLVILKAAMAGLIFLIGARIMPYRFAFLGSLLFILCWGDPLFPHILYGNHCVHFLSLLIILSMSGYIDSGKTRWLMVAGLLSGVAVLFKVPTGLFILVSLGMFLSYKEQFFETADPAAVEAEEHSNIVLKFAPLTRYVKMGIIVGCGAVFILYFRTYRLDLYYFIIFLLPLFAFLALLFVQEIVLFQKLDQKNHAVQAWTNFRTFLREVFLLAMGPACLFLLQILYYMRAGGLEEMVYDTFVLPSVINYYWPLDSPGMHAAYIIFIVLAATCIVLVTERYKGKEGFGKPIFLLATLILILLPMTYGLTYGVRFRGWHEQVTQVIQTAGLLLAFPFFLPTKQHDPEDTRNKLAVSLPYFFAAFYLIMAFPRSDETHFIQNETVIFVIIAFVLWRLGERCRAFFPEKQRTIAQAACTGALVLLIAYPLLWSLKIFFVPSAPRGYEQHLPQGMKRYPVLTFNAPRANGLKLPMSEFYTPPLHRFEMVDLEHTVEFIRHHTTPDERIFVISEHQVIYFLSERDTILPKKNYFTYLSNFEFVNFGIDVRLTDEEIVERLIEASPPYIVRQVDDLETYNFLSTWPKTASLIEIAYSDVAEFGRFRVLGLRGGKDFP